MNKDILIKLLFHVIILLISYLLLFQFNVVKAWPDNINLLNWDGEFNYSIMEDGYEYIPYSGSNMAFFPLFPLFWKLTSFSAIWISALNFAVFLCAIFWLFKTEKVSGQQLLFILSIPSFIFFALPYSESAFFLSAVLIVVGYRDENPTLKNLGFFLASLAKSVSIVLIPAIILCEFISHSYQQSRPKNHKPIYLSIGSSILGVFIVGLVQGIQTGKWFYFFEMQQFWGRRWIIPEIPLHTPVAYDAIAWIFGVFAIYFCFKHFLSIYFPKMTGNQNAVLTKPVFFSLMFMSATTILDTFFTYNMGGANLWSLNRHLFCTPFTVVFIIWLIRDFQPTKSDCIFIFSMLTFGLYLTDAYLSYKITFCYILFYSTLILLKLRPHFVPLLLAIYLINCVILISYYTDFLSGKWIG